MSARARSISGPVAELLREFGIETLDEQAATTVNTALSASGLTSRPALTAQLQPTTRVRITADTQAGGARPINQLGVAAAVLGAIVTTVAVVRRYRRSRRAGVDGGQAGPMGPRVRARRRTGRPRGQQAHAGRVVQLKRLEVTADSVDPRGSPYRSIGCEHGPRNQGWRGRPVPLVRHAVRAARSNPRTNPRPSRND